MEDDNWEIFFNKAGIGEPTANHYAKIFKENKISSSILKCLNKGFLLSMDIRPMGDIIRILEYIKIIKTEKTSEPLTMFGGVTGIAPSQNVNIGVNALTRQSCSTNSMRVVNPESKGRVTALRPIQPAPIKHEPTISNNPLVTPARVIILSNTSQLECKPVASISKQANISSVKCGEKSEKSWCVNVNIDAEDTEDETEISTMLEVGCEHPNLLKANNRLFLQPLNDNLPTNSLKSPTKMSQMLPLSTVGGGIKSANNINNKIRFRKKYNRTTKEIREVIIRTMNTRISPKEIGKLLDVSLRTVYKFQRQYKRTGSIESKIRVPRKPRVTPEAEEYIKHLIDMDCTLTLREISEKLKCDLGFHASVTSLSRYLKKMKYTFKKVSRANGGLVIEGTNRLVHGYRVPKKH